MIFYVNCPIIQEEQFPSSQTLRIIAFVLLSYIVGTLMQEMASWIDDNCKIMKMRIKAGENFLISNLLFKDEEYEEIKKAANKILGKGQTYNRFSEGENYKIFNIYKSHLENNNKMDKADKLDAIFAMSRDFIVCNISILTCLIITVINKIIIKQFEWSWSYAVILLYVIGSSAIFYKRAKRYSELRTKTIIRQYMDLKRK